MEDKNARDTFIQWLATYKQNVQPGTNVELMMEAATEKKIRF